MSIADLVRKAIPEAMKAKDSVRLGAARLAQAALKNREIEKIGALDDADEQKVIATLVKQRRESIEQFKKGGRSELVQQEEQELAFYLSLLPTQLSAEEITQEVATAIAAAGAKGPQDMGKVMGPLMKKLAGRADGAVVKAIVCEKLGSV